MSNLIPVAEALDALFALITPLETEEVALVDCAGRVLARDAVARRNQPPFPASAMDGYAVQSGDAQPGAQLRVIGESAAGHGWSGVVGPGEALRIFTGAPVPEGADRVVIQEDVAADREIITVRDTLGGGDNIRPAGCDFAIGHRMAAPRRLTPSDIALAASMNLPVLPVAKRPEVAIIATGDELVLPGETPAPDQIIASNSFGLKAMFEAEGAHVRMLPIARDTPDALSSVFALANGADLIVTIGGASVGDHDFVEEVTAGLGMERAFYKIAMRPGKPLMCGRLGRAVMVGLPGNPVSSMVCGILFVVPALRALQGLRPAPMARLKGRLAVDVETNGPREHYMRAGLELRDGTYWLHPERRQDSSLLSVLSGADCLVVRAPHAPAVSAGTDAEFIPLS